MAALTKEPLSLVDRKGEVPFLVKRSSLFVLTSSQLEKSHKYGNTQVDIPKDSAVYWAHKGLSETIPDSELAGNGRVEPHITVKYGIIPYTDTKELARHLASQTAFKAKVGKITHFPATKNSDGAVPIIAKIISPELEKLNLTIGDRADFKPADFEYHPHMTIAYVKEGSPVISQLEGSDQLEGMEIPVEVILIATPLDHTKEQAVHLQPNLELAAKSILTQKVTDSQIEPGVPAKTDSTNQDADFSEDMDVVDEDVESPSVLVFPPAQNGIGGSTSGQGEFNGPANPWAQKLNPTGKNQYSGESIAANLTTGKRSGAYQYLNHDGKEIGYIQHPDSNSPWGGVFGNYDAYYYTPREHFVGSFKSEEEARLGLANEHASRLNSADKVSKAKPTVIFSKDHEDLQDPLLATPAAQVEAILERLFDKQKLLALQTAQKVFSTRKTGKTLITCPACESGDCLSHQLHKARKLEGRTTFQGLDISIENGVGSTRSGKDGSGKPWSITMTYPYGYIRMTEGVDGDHVDCFIGPDPDTKYAYVIRTTDQETNQYDEDKVMLGWDSPESAVAAFLENYTSPSFFRDVEEIPMQQFKELVLATKDNPARVTTAKLFKAEISQDALVTDINAVIDATWSSLPADIQDQLVSASTSQALVAIGQLHITDEGLISDINEQAAAWARNRAAEMVGMKWVEGELVPNPDAKWVISETTRDEIRGAVVDIFGVEHYEGEEYYEEEEERGKIEERHQKLEEQLQRLGAFSKSRAENIARTEIKMAATQGHWTAWQQSGLVEEVGWLISSLGDVCPICINLYEESPYPFESAPHPVYDSHPRCRCSIYASKLREQPLQRVFAKAAQLYVAKFDNPKWTDLIFGDALAAGPVDEKK